MPAAPPKPLRTSHFLSLDPHTQVKLPPVRCRPAGMGNHDRRPRPQPAPTASSCSSTSRNQPTQSALFLRARSLPATTSWPKARKPAVAMNNSPPGHVSVPLRSPSLLPADTRTSTSTSAPASRILTTGDELVPVDATPGPGKIRNSNAPMLAALVANAGAEPIVLPTAPTPPKPSTPRWRKFRTTDMLLISGGVSAGKFDLVEPALARLGAQFHFTGVRIQPGKPLVFGQIPRSGGSSTAQVFFGLPGNPISSAATFHLFAAPIIAALAGSREIHPRFVLAHLSRDTDRKTKPGLTRFLPALCAFNPSVNEFPKSPLVPWQGSGDLTAFARSNCFLVIPEDAGFLEAGSTVHILLH